MWSTDFPNMFHAPNRCRFHSSFQVECPWISSQPYDVLSKRPKVFRPVVLYKECATEYSSNSETNSQGTGTSEIKSNQLHSDVSNAAGKVPEIGSTDELLPVSIGQSRMTDNRSKSQRHPYQKCTGANERLPLHSDLDNLTSDFRNKDFDTRFSKTQINMGTDDAENPSFFRCTINPYEHYENIATFTLGSLNRESLPVLRQGITHSKESVSAMPSLKENMVLPFIQNNWTDPRYQKASWNYNDIAKAFFPHWAFSDSNHVLCSGKETQQSAVFNCRMANSSRDSFWNNSCACPSLLNSIPAVTRFSQHLYPKNGGLTRSENSAFSYATRHFFGNNHFHDACVFPGDQGVDIEQENAYFMKEQTHDIEKRVSEMTGGKKSNASAERPFKCECGRTFARSEELTRHKRIHSGYKPHRCNICTKHFGRKDHLNKHLKTHLGTSEKKTHLCTIPGCRLSYTRSDALTRHQWTTHGIPPKASKWRPRKGRNFDGV